MSGGVWGGGGLLRDRDPLLGHCCWSGYRQRSRRNTTGCWWYVNQICELRGYKPGFVFWWNPPSKKQALFDNSRWTIRFDVPEDGFGKQQENCWSDHQGNWNIPSGEGWRSNPEEMRIHKCISNESQKKSALCCFCPLWIKLLCCNHCWLSTFAYRLCFFGDTLFSMPSPTEVDLWVAFDYCSVICQSIPLIEVRDSCNYALSVHVQHHIVTSTRVFCVAVHICIWSYMKRELFSL